MNFVHQNVQSNNNYCGSTPLKNLSTRLTYPTWSGECKQLTSPDYENTKSNGLLEVQSVISFGQQQIKKSQINELFQTMRLIRFLDKEAKQLSKMINLKNKNISVLYQKREDKIKDIREVKKQTQTQYEYLRQKSKEIKLRNKQRQINMNYKIKLMKQKIRRVKSLSQEQSRLTYTETNRNTNRHQNRSKYKHKRMYSQWTNQYQTKGANNKVFIPIYIPYPVFSPYNQLPQNFQRNSKYQNSDYNPQMEYYQIKENSLKNSQRHSQYNINTEQTQEYKIKDFCTKLKEPLVNKQSKRYIRKQSRKSQNLQSLRNSIKTSSQKSQMKPKVNKGPFETDQEINQDELGGKSLMNDKNIYSKMGIKITSSNTCEDQTQEFNNKCKKINKDISNVQILQQLQNSTINLDIPSDKKQNSSWERETIERLNKFQVKHNSKQLKSKIKVSDKQLSGILPLQSDSMNSSLKGSEINIIITQSPSKHKASIGLKKVSSSKQDQNQRNIENNDLIQGKQSKKANQQLLKANQFNLMSLKKGEILQIVDQSKIKYISSSRINIDDLSDQDIFGSINLVPESKISRNSRNKEAENKQIKEQEDQILSCINLTPQSRISRLSRQKEALKVSRSQLKQANAIPIVNLKTSIGDIRQSKAFNTIKNPLTNSQENQLQLIQHSSELRSTTPSRIIQKGKKPKRQSQKIDFMSASIEEATQEEQNNLMSQIQYKNNKRSRHLTK